jgi:DNA-binding response OmpR family regulator
MRVLIVDDCELSAGMLAVVLEVYGHQVRLLSTVGTPLKVAAEFRPHLVLLALPSPITESELELVRQLRDQSEEDLQILATCDVPAQLSSDEQRGFDAVFARPIRFGQIKPFLEAPVRQLHMTG